MSFLKKSKPKSAAQKPTGNLKSTIKLTNRQMPKLPEGFFDKYKPKPHNKAVSFLEFQPPKKQISDFRIILKEEALIRKDFLKTFHTLEANHRALDIWSDLITMIACAISNSLDGYHYEEREKRYLETIQKYDKNEQKLFPDLFAYIVLALEKNREQDFLGSIYTELGLYDKNRQQIFTPYPICHMMANMSMGDIVNEVEKKGFVTIDDCCCGGGATLIAACNVAREKLEKAGLNWQNHILISAQDIDETVALMCYIQLSLIGAAAYIKVGNSLTNPISSEDTLDNYWFTPMYFSNVWEQRRLINRLSALMDKK